MRCALVVGHTPVAPGAVSPSSGLTEYAYNELLARRIAGLVTGLEIRVVYRGLPDDLAGLPAKVNQLRPDFIVSLHANAFDQRATGSEVLYWHRSVKGKRLAELLQAEFLVALGLKDRGLKPRQPGDRGAHLLMRTAAPCVIGEPFFIDNDADLCVATERSGELALAYARAIEAFAGELAG